MNRKRLTPALFLFLSVSVHALMAGQKIEFKNAVNNGRTVDLAASANTGVVLNISVPELETSVQAAKEGTFLLLTIPGYGYNTEIGSPRLPVISEWVEIPQGAAVEAVAEARASEGFNLKDKGFDMKVMPVQLPVPKIPGAEDKVPFSLNQTAYSKDAFYGRQGVTVSDPVQMRGHRAVLVSFWPVSYNPVSGDINVVTKADIYLKFTGSDMAKTAAAYEKYSSAAYDASLSSLLLNYNAYPPSSKVIPAVPINELIITGDQFQTALQPLIEWDIRKGYHTTVVKTSEIPGGADTTHIRQYIKSQYDGENPPDFVLLVGDVNAIPACSTTTGTDRPITDLYYSTMAGTDFVPDLYISRISVADTTQLHNYIAKYLGYQQGEWTSNHSWMQKAYFTSTSDAGNHAVTDETDNYCMALARAHSMICDSLYAYYSTGTPVADAFNDGRAIMSYTGHGDITYWAGPVFNQSNVNSLTNADKYAFVTSFACLTNRFAEPECFGETWIRAANKGAIAYWGSAVYSYWAEDDILQRRMYDALLDSGYTWIGGMTLKAKLDFGRFYDWTSAVSVSVKQYFEQYNILGSSAIDLFTQQPAAMTVNHPATVPLGPATVDINVTAGGAVPNALVSLTTFSGKEALGSGYTDASGNISFDILTTDIDSIYVVAMAHNNATYIGKINITVSGPCVMHYKHVLVDTAGNSDGQANPGESIIMPLWVKNYGSTVSTGTIKGTLRVTSGPATVTDSLYNFGLVYPGDSAQYSAGYRFNVSPACSNGTDISFALECRDDDTSWTTAINIKVSAPKLRYSSYLIIDPSPANGNCFAEPGETDSLKVLIKNYGLMAADNVTAKISTTDPYITILSDSSGNGTINPGENGISTIPYLATFGTPPTNPYYGWIQMEMRTLNGLMVAYDSFAVSIAPPGFYDNVEDTLVTAQYQAGYLWHTTEYTSYSPTTCWRCGVGDAGNYVDTMNSSLVTPEFVVGTDATISFWHKYWIESGYDYGYLEYTLDGGVNWIELDSYTGNVTSWTQQSYNLSNITLGSKIKLRFRFASDVSLTYQGWHIDDITVTTTTGVAGKPNKTEIPTSFSLGQSYPNPTSGFTSIAYQVPQRCKVALTVYNIIGQTVKTLENGVKEPGLYRVNWDGRDQNGRKAAAGIYFYRLSGGGANITQKLIMIK